MKKLIMMLLIAVSIGLGGVASPICTPEPSSTCSASANFNFRSTQKLRSSDRYELYLYTDHTVAMFDDEGGSAGSGTWQMRNEEIYIYSNGGSLIAKCECRISQGELKWIKFRGETYWKI